MTLLNQEDSIVLIVDVQEKLLNAIFNKDEVLKNSTILAKATNMLNIPVIVTEQYPKGLGCTIGSVKESLNNAKYFEKTTFSALDNADVFDLLKKYNKKQVLIFGIETHICVNQTVYSLKRRGYDVYLVKNACGSRVLDEHLAGLECIKSYNANIITAEIALFEWLRGAGHPQFKEIQALIK